MELYPHNQVTYNKVFMMLAEHKECALIQGTGTGKSFILMKLLDTIFQGKDVLMVVPYESIKEGILLYDDWNYPNVRFTTYAGLKNITQAPEVLVVDELHRAGAPTWNEEVRRLRVGAEYFLGMTATQYRYLEKKRDMATELFGEHVVTGPTYDEAIQLGILCGYDYYAILSDPEEYVAKIDSTCPNFELKQKVKALRLDEYQLTERIRSHINDTYRKWVIFYPNIEALEQADLEIRQWFGEHEVTIYKVYSKQSRKVNRENIQKFNGDTGFCCIISIDMLNEGVHLKGITGVIMASRTSSGNVFTQQMGRGATTDKRVRIKYLDLVKNFDNVRVMCKTIDNVRARVPAGEKHKEEVIELTQVMVCYDEILLTLEDILAKAEGRWSEYDDDIVRAYYPVEGSACWLRIPYRTEAQVRTRARVLGVTKTRKWSEVEDNILHRYYKEERDAIWKRLPSRSVSAIRGRAKKLGLVTEWTSQEDLILLKEYEVTESRRLYSMFIGKTEEEIEERARKLGLHRIVDFV